MNPIINDSPARRIVGWTIIQPETLNIVAHIDLKPFCAGFIAWWS
ncbi:hypothetical protein QQS45_08215 [Alteriqipengyuania flavescens]|nr:hypothetical protein [Alteriqipengyuania flavescens]WJY17635.1 hypothetical protein QQW98_08210 [Alteriqipengyuania flavescens]WJY23578.1 hypothetical protein QQS45_08215 [Alteriqipengyuania flavescens]